MAESDLQPTYDEVVSVMQQRFPREYEIAVLTVRNAKMERMMQQGARTLPDAVMAPAEESPDDDA